MSPSIRWTSFDTRSITWPVENLNKVSLLRRSACKKQNSSYIYLGMKSSLTKIAITIFIMLLHSMWIVTILWLHVFLSCVYSDCLVIMIRADNDDDESDWNLGTFYLWFLWIMSSSSMNWLCHLQKRNFYVTSNKVLWTMCSRWMNNFLSCWPLHCLNISLNYRFHRFDITIIHVQRPLLFFS